MNTLLQTTPKYQAQIRLNAIVRLNLKPTYHKTLLAVDSFLNSTTGACFPSVKTLAHRRGLSERATQYHLCKLEGLGLLERRARYADTGRQRSNLFIPSYVQRAHPYMGGVSDTERQTLHPSLSDSCTHNQSTDVEPKKEKEKEKIPTVTNPFHIGGSSFSYGLLLQQFFNSPKEDRGLLVHSYQWEAERGSTDHQRLCDRMRWAWRQEA